MNPSYFAWWLGKQPPSGMNEEDVELIRLEEIKDMEPKDLIAILFYGSVEQGIFAVDALRSRFEWELHAIEQMNYPREEA